MEVPVWYLLCHLWEYFLTYQDISAEENKTLDKINKLNVTKDVELKIPSLDGWNSWDIEAKRDVAKTLIEKVYIYKDRIHIKWAY